MDFEYTPEQIHLRKAVREFAEAEIAPHVMEWDEAQTFPLEVVRKLGKLGYMGAIFPEELGGSGLGYIEYSIIIEELSRVDGSVGIIVAAHTSLCSNHIYKMGSEEQQRRYLPKLASGEWLGCWSLTEPEAGSDAAGTRTHAELEDGMWVLNGAKTFTTNAHYADRLRGHGGHRSRRRAARHLGLHHREGHARLPLRQEGKQARHARQRHRRSDLRELPPRAGAAPRQAERGLRGQPAKCWTAAASPSPRSPSAWRRAPTTRRCKYSKQRKQFGRPISEFQAIQHKLVDMAVEIDAARLLNYRAAWMLDRGMRVTRESAMAKLFASEAAVRIADEAVQIHGGYGFIKDYPVEKFYRDVKLCTIGEGTSEIQRLVIARQLLKS